MLFFSAYRGVFGWLLVSFFDYRKIFDWLLVNVIVLCILGLKYVL